MHHEEHDPRHPQHQRRPDYRHEPPRHQYNDEHFHDFRSRWGNPSPAFGRHPNEWRTWEDNDFLNRGHYHHREEWLPDHDQRWQDRRMSPPLPPPSNRPPIWQQQDVNFHSSNQHANDRWQYDHYMPHPDPNHPHRRQARPDRFWDDRLR